MSKKYFIRNKSLLLTGTPRYSYSSQIHSSALFRWVRPEARGWQISTVVHRIVHVDHYFTVYLVKSGYEGCSEHKRCRDARGTEAAGHQVMTQVRQRADMKHLHGWLGSYGYTDVYHCPCSPPSTFSFYRTLVPPYNSCRVQERPEVLMHSVWPGTVIHS